MDKLRAMGLFVQLADLGSFTKVAEHNGSSKSMISKEIGRLEQELGVRLLHRTTRNVQMTHAGQEYLQRVREILLKVDDADAFIGNLQGNLRGKLKINAPMALGISELSDMFADFMLAHPEVELDIHLGDKPVDLVEHGFDLGFRASSTTLDSNYIGRPLTTFNYRVCASPEYLNKHATINKPADLVHHNCFVYSYFNSKNEWPIDGGVKIQGNLKVNSTPFMLASIKKGLGIGFLPDFVCNEAIQKGEVVEILEESKKTPLTLYALYPARHYVPAKLALCIEYMEKWFGSAKS